jgi:anti-sigma factor RsiW
MDPTISVTEEELHAWLDGELPPERMDAVEAHLAAHPEDVARLEAYRADGEALARVFAYAGEAAIRASEPIPFIRRAAPARHVVAFSGWRRAAAVALIFGAGAASGWFGRDRIPAQPDDLARFAAEAAATHTVLASATEPLTVDGRPRNELQAALSAAFGVSVKLPAAERIGYQLVGAALVPAPSGRALQLTFRDQSGSKDSEITVYFQHKPGAEETPFRRFDAASVTTMAWEDDDLGCAISGAVSADRIEQMGRLMYEAFEAKDT